MRRRPDHVAGGDEQGQRREVRGEVQDLGVRRGARHAETEQHDETEVRNEPVPGPKTPS